MRLQIQLQNRPGSLLTLNYSYLFSSAIYHILEQADPAFSEWLHSVGYRLEGRQFKMFTFSHLHFGRGFRVLPKEGMVSLGRRQELQISFLVPKTVETFVKGVFQDRRFGIGTARQYPVDFALESVAMLPPPEFQPTMRFRTLSPIVVSEYQDGETHEQYLSPEAPNYAERLSDNLRNKYESAHQHGLVGALPAGGGAGLSFRLLSQPKSRLVHIKSGTAAETKVRGFLYEFEVSGPVELLRLGYEVGFGLQNSMGFGMVGEMSV